MLIIRFILSLPEPLRFIFLKTLFYTELGLWHLHWRPLPPLKAVKVLAILESAKRYNITCFVETGTYLGETVELTKKYFEKIYSIEISKKLYKIANKNFLDDRNVKILLGDSATILPKLLKRIRKPCLFWLDAHFSGGITAKGQKDTPILKELEIISKNKVNGSVILIDDAREFSGRGDYPKLGSIRKFVANKFPNYKITVKDDIIRIYPDE